MYSSLLLELASLAQHEGWAKSIFRLFQRGGMDVYIPAFDQIRD